MKLVYLTVDGRAKVENWTINARNVEMMDGPHPVTNDSVWQDSKRLGPALMFIIQDVLAPYGGSMAARDVKTRIYEVKLASMAFKAPSLSKMWVRWLQNMFDWVTSHIVYLFIAVIVGYSLLGSFGVV